MQNIHKHTSFSNINTSFKDSHISYEAYCKRAHELGHRVITSVEHGFQSNYLKVNQIIEKYNSDNEDANLKFVYGVEAYWVKDRHEQDKTNGHILILARNEEGIREINFMLSEANLTGFYYVPRVDMELLKTLTPENVLVTTACVGFWGKVDRDTKEVKWHYSPAPEDEEEFIPCKDEILDIFCQLYDHFGSSLYLEVQAHNTRWQREVNVLVLDLHYRYNVPLIAGLDSHYISEDQIIERQYLREESGVKMGDEDHEFDREVYEDYPDEKTFVERMKLQGILSSSEIREAMDNTDIALTFDDIVFNKDRKLPTIYPELSLEERNKLYSDHILSSWEKYRQNKPVTKWEEYERDIAYESGIIQSTGVADYFLLNEEVIRLGVENGGIITPTGRGSSGSFITNTFLGLSTLDRLTLPVKLYPERFVTADRLKSSLPDIDFNVSDQEPFQQAQQQLLGEWGAIQMIAYGTLKEKGAFKMYARANNLPVDEQNEVASQIEKYEKALKYADDDERDTIVVEDYVDEEYLHFIEDSKPYKGIVVSKSPAPSAFLLFNGDLRREVGIMRVASKTSKKVTYCTVVDGYTAEAYGYVKNDLLIVSVLSVNKDAMRRAGLPSYTSEEIIELTRNDKKTWDIFAKGYTMGINQCERAASVPKLMQYKPQTLEDLSAFIAAIRPGFRSQLQSFLAREKFEYKIPSFDAILKNDSSGSSWMLYQENIMSCLNIAGFEMDETYPLIKAISKKDAKKIMPAKERFLTGFASHLMSGEGVAEEAAHEAAGIVWKVIEDSSNYSFNASHAVAVALDALYGAYLKANYPHEYYAALLTKVALKGDKDRLTDIRAEMKRAFDISLAPCRFGYDAMDYVIDRDSNSITDVLAAAKGISFPTARALNEIGDGFYTNFIELLIAMDSRRELNSAKIITLIWIGYFKDFGSRAKLLKLYEEFREGKNRYDKKHTDKTKVKRIAALVDIEENMEEPPPVDSMQILQKEAETYNTPISIFPELKGFAVVTDIDTKYSPTLTLYNPAKGTMGKMKVLKNTYTSNEIKKGDIIEITGFKTQPVKKWDSKKKKRVSIPGMTEHWITDYIICEVC